jgi:hypothetical protein
MAGIVVKKHVRAGTLVLAVCDSELLGKQFENDKMQLDLAGAFYQGEEIPGEEIEHLLQAAQSAHIVGPESIAFVQQIFPDLEPISIGDTTFATLFKL